MPEDVVAALPIEEKSELDQETGIGAPVAHADLLGMDKDYAIPDLPAPTAPAPARYNPPSGDAMLTELAELGLDPQ